MDKRNLKLTDKQREILEFITSYNSIHNHSPTLSEISKKFNKTRRTIAQHLEALERKGAILKTGEFRGIILLGRESQKRLIENGMEEIAVSSLIGCDNACVFGDDQIQDYVLVSKKMIEKHGKLIAGKALGYSMIKENINPDDILLIKPTKTPKNNEIMVIKIGEMVLAKKVRISEKTITFLPCTDSEEYKPLVFDRKDDSYEILGLVVDIIKKEENSEEDYQYIKEGEV